MKSLQNVVKTDRGYFLVSTRIKHMNSETYETLVLPCTEEGKVTSGIPEYSLVCTSEIIAKEHHNSAVTRLSKGVKL